MIKCHVRYGVVLDSLDSLDPVQHTLADVSLTEFHNLIESQVTIHLILQVHL